jgi:hypothetical protein
VTVDQPLPLEGVEIRAMVRRWRAIIIGIAFALPIISVVLEQAARAFPDSDFVMIYLQFLGVPRRLVRPYNAAGWWGILASPILALVFNWPLLVFATRITTHITRYWPHRRAATVATVVSTLGLVVLYGFFFVRLPSDSFFNAGAGVPFLAPFIWLIGWLFVLAVLKLGLAIVKFRRAT